MILKRMDLFRIFRVIVVGICLEHINFIAIAFTYCFFYHISIQPNDPSSPFLLFWNFSFISTIFKAISLFFYLSFST